MEGGVVGVQHGPIQMFLGLALDVFSLEHLIWSHPLHLEHRTDVLVICFEQTGQNQCTGPGFCSTPALMSRSRIRQAGSALFFVRQIKNSVLRDIPHCRSY